MDSSSNFREGWIGGVRAGKRISAWLSKTKARQAFFAFSIVFPVFSAVFKMWVARAKKYVKAVFFIVFPVVSPRKWLSLGLMEWRAGFALPVAAGLHAVAG